MGALRGWPGLLTLEGSVADFDGMLMVVEPEVRAGGDEKIGPVLDVVHMSPGVEDDREDANPPEGGGTGVRSIVHSSRNCWLLATVVRGPRLFSAYAISFLWSQTPRIFGSHVLYFHFLPPQAPHRLS